MDEEFVLENLNKCQLTNFLFVLTNNFFRERKTCHRFCFSQPKVFVSYSLRVRWKKRVLIFCFSSFFSNFKKLKKI